MVVATTVATGAGGGKTNHYCRCPVLLFLGRMPPWRCQCFGVPRTLCWLTFTETAVMTGAMTTAGVTVIEIVIRDREIVIGAETGAGAGAGAATVRATATIF